MNFMVGMFRDESTDLLFCYTHDYSETTKKTIESVDKLINQLLDLKEVSGCVVLTSVDEKIFYLKKFRDELIANIEKSQRFLSEFNRISKSCGQYPQSTGGPSALWVTNDPLVEQACNCETTAKELSYDFGASFEKACRSFDGSMSPELEEVIACVDSCKKTSEKLIGALLDMSSNFRKSHEAYLQADALSSFELFDNRPKPADSCGNSLSDRCASTDTAAIPIQIVTDTSASMAPTPPPPCAKTAPRPRVSEDTDVLLALKEEERRRRYAEEEQLKKSIADAETSDMGSSNPKMMQTKKKGGILGLFKRKKTDNHNENQIVPPPQIDSVKFSAISAKKVVPGKYLPINIVMYEDEFRKAVDKIIDSYGGNAKETASGYHNVERNSTVKVVLTSPDLAIEDGVEEQVWNGKYLDFSFAVKIPREFCDEEILFTATVYVNDIIATKLKLILECDKKSRCSVSLTRSDILSAFVSYASQDRNRVASIIQGMQKARPDMDIFFDIETLRSGQRWEDALKNEIESRDVLFLCWSKYARESKWVDMEWRYAFENKGEDCIEPIPIDSPDICPPPVELQQKHFNDKMLFIIKATEN